MQAHAELIVGPPARPGRGCRVERVVNAAPVGWRFTSEAVYLVGTAASPVGGDQVFIDVVVRSGAALTIRSTAATVLWRGWGTSHQVRVRVATGASLEWILEPVVTTSGCEHQQTATVQLEGTASVRWRELLVLGREGEASGALVSSLSADLDGVPLLRHSLAIGPDAPAWDGPAVLGSDRVLGLELFAGTRLPRPVATAGAGWALHALDGPASLAVAAGATITDVRAALVEAAGVRPGGPPQTAPRSGLGVR